ncbi:uncharacterized protein LOC118349222 [Juglans regia]|uniref:Uncharacterized protein LOC118349222 n=1 Tax=Juglans regia TaxID=51240 RepID=A0A6P9EJX4_JUGRE|nr:uncharacterized protein LOC118349222 [Juglans regia]
MAEGTRINQLQESLSGLKKSTESQLQTLETEVLALKRQSDAVVHQLAALTVEIQKKNAENPNREESSSGMNRNRQEGFGEVNGEIVARSVRISFPSFQGEDPLGWLYKVNQFFLFYNTPPHHKVRLASFHMEGKAMVWFQEIESTGTFIDWEGFVRVFLARFGPNSYDDPMETLTRLRQTGSVEEYKVEFEAISNRLRRLSDSHKLSCFLSGLKDEIRFQVRMFNPPDLLAAFSLAKLQEEHLKSSKKGVKNFLTTNTESGIHRGQGNYQGIGGGKAIVPVQKINAGQMKERRDKGLCYYCDSKWNPGHKCKNPKLFLIEEVEEEEGGMFESRPQMVMVQEGEEEMVRVEEPLKPEISLHALIGSSNPRTMRVMGRVNGQGIVILIDSGSTHNFLDSGVARRVKLPICADKKVKVRVANGDQVVSEGLGKNVKVLVQGNAFTIDLFVMELVGCHMVLGIQWLQSLGTITWNFKKLTMRFLGQGQEVMLQGLISSQFIEEGSYNKISNLEKKGVILQMINQEDKEEEQNMSQNMRAVLEQFSDVFQEPKGLPPIRTHDHAINLLPGAKPVSVRPYRYPFFQKDEIEKIVKELLGTGVIKPSHSSYSSPVLLVRKADG